ncbi:YlbF family regulator [Paenibacillus flagellatus]|uniref:Regulator n=1 Tax=Paenibacillus flagellatus TaxID=2211139 RepID=A0A2V5K4Y2_9BACL|nr:YlbF family regulator [Paenibacillus flagellatus]PYI54389.1 regulator [Paenibacillus flagellatus]
MIGTIETLDMGQLLLQAYEIGDMINSSAEVADYLHWKKAVERDPDVQDAVSAFAKAKESFQDCERFGHFHPDYHAALEVVQQAQARLDSFDAVRRFKEAEARLDDLLFRVSETIAHSVSDTIKVPSNNPLPTKGCGGNCNGGCG